MYDELKHDFGVGDGTTTACVNSLAYLQWAEQCGIDRETAMADFTDTVECICPVVRRLSIRINDRRAYWPDAAEATAWMHATAPKLLGTNGSVDLMRRRAFRCADAAVREIAPAWFDLAAEKWPGAAEWATKLRDCEPVTDTRTARAAKAVADKARAAAAAYAAAYADAAADADADAAAYAATTPPKADAALITAAINALPALLQLAEVVNGAPVVETVAHDEGGDEVPMIFAPDGITVGQRFHLVPAAGGE